MRSAIVVCALGVLAAPASALVCRDTGAVTRRGLLQKTVAAAVPLLTLGAAPVWADTQPQFAEQGQKSMDNEEKRKKFLAAQKVYKKAWRKELAQFEYATSDLETMEALEAMITVRPSRGPATSLTPAHGAALSAYPPQQTVAAPPHSRTAPPTQMIKRNNGDIPEGVRRQDLDQIYKRIKVNMGKTARMTFLKLDETVRNAERVKNMAEDDGL